MYYYLDSNKSNISPSLLKIPANILVFSIGGLNKVQTTFCCKLLKSLLGPRLIAPNYSYK